MNGLGFHTQPQVHILWREVRILWAAIGICLCLMPLALQAKTVDTLLDLIGSLEAPEGYNQVYGGIKYPPPKTLSFMSVGEVLDWQKKVARTSVSTAAGRYQIIRPTLQSLVDQGIVRRTDIFSPATQDRLARHLLAETGYRDGVVDPKVANRIAGIWAALPLVSGSGAGASAYQGVAGNHALISAQDYMAVLRGDMDVSSAKRVARAVARVISFGHFIEKTFTAIGEIRDHIAQNIKTHALTGLLIFFTAQLIWHVGRAVVQGDYEGIILNQITRLSFLTFVSFFILQAPALFEALERIIGHLLKSLDAGRDIDLAGFLVAKAILSIEITEAALNLSMALKLPLLLITALSWLLTLLTAALVIWHYTSVYLMLGLSVFAIAFSALDVFADTLWNALSTLTQAMLRILSLHIIFFVFAHLQGLHEPIPLYDDPLSTSATLLMLDVLMTLMVATFPSHIAKIGQLGRGSA